MTEVVLSWPECMLATEAGRLRQVRALRSGYKDRHGFAGDGWGVHIEGAAGEMAVAKLLGVYYDPALDSFKTLGDVGGLEVRTRSRHDYELIIRPDDPDRAFVLVTGRMPRYQVRGWYRAADVRDRPDWMQEHGGRPPAWFVPTSELRPIEELRQ